MSRLQMARAIGYTGTDRNDADRVRKHESAELVPLYLARLVWLIHKIILDGRVARLGVDDDGNLQGFPNWAGYEFEHTPDTEVRGK